MANATALFGFRHVGDLSGGSPTYQLVSRQIQSTNSTKIGRGDPVLKDTSNKGYIVQATGALATTTPIEGIFDSCEFIPSAGNTVQYGNSFPGSTNADAKGYLINSPFAMFLVGTLQTAIVSTNIGNLVNFTTGVPSATGYSPALIDQATATATGTTASLLPFKIVGLYTGAGGGDATSNNNWVFVTFNNQMFHTLAGGV
jgi:hypothetical protein